MISVGAAGAKILRESLEEPTPPTIRLTTRVSTGWREIPTLVAQLDGTEEPEKFVLFSGHIDSWHRGAMDNGSANALMLEVLRVLLPHRERLRRSLRLAFWSGHSHGRYAGSTWYADNFWEDLHENCVLHLNTDSPGGRGATVVTEGQAMAETRDVAADAVRALTGEEFNGSRFGRSGDQSFMSLGIPSLFMFVSEQPPGQDASAGDVAALLGGPGAKGGGVGWWWHTTEDTPDKLDPELPCPGRPDLRRGRAPLPLGAGSSPGCSSFRGGIAWSPPRLEREVPKSASTSPPWSRGRKKSRISRTSSRAAGSCGGQQARRASELNEALRRVELGLVRLNYARSDPFDHDPAVAQPPVPLLAPVDRLLLTDRGSDEEREIMTLLVRRRNRCHARAGAGRR